MVQIHSAEFVQSCVTPRHYPKERLPEFAFMGRSNVGKSSLINSLLNRKGLAKVSGTPGKTRTINFFSVGTADPVIKRFFLVDLPGFGFAKVSQDVRKQWGPMIEQYLRGREQLCGVVFLFDVRRVESPDNATVQWLRSVGCNILFVGTKVDKLTRSERGVLEKKVRQSFELDQTDSLVLYSSQTHEGRKELWINLRRLVEENQM